MIILQSHATVFVLRSSVLCQGGLNCCPGFFRQAVTQLSYRCFHYRGYVASVDVLTGLQTFWKENGLVITEVLYQNFHGEIERKPLIIVYM
jgi:hypothetical protein